LVTPHNWLFLSAYERLREALLGDASWNLVARLGPGAFETIGGEVVNVALLAFSNQPPTTEHAIWGCDISATEGAVQKATKLRQADGRCVGQRSQLGNPDARITLDEGTSGTLLEFYAHGVHGLGTKDSLRFIRQFWEIVGRADDWQFLQTTTEQTHPWSGLEQVVFWQGGNGILHELGRQGWAVLAGGMAWGKPGVCVSQMGDLPASLYSGEIFDKNAAVVLPHDPTHVPAIWAFCASPLFAKAVRQIDQALKVTNNTLVKVPFDLAHWQRVAAEKYPKGLPEPDSNDPTQWLFNGRLRDSTAPLQVGVARLLGYRWPRQTGQTVSGAAPVPEDGLEKFADEDGIVCIPSVRGEAPAAERLRALLAAAYGKAWSPAKQDELLAQASGNPQSAIRNPQSLEDWLRNGFFDQHCKLFHHRPFIWQIWDGRKDGFSALVNYHKLDHKLLEKLTYTYLGDWIKKQQEAVANEESGADDRLLKAQQLQAKLKLILEGEAPYDIFVRWKPLEQQPIGWHPDLNDGVRLNIRPFMEADVLRKRPNIKWGKDRGKNPPGSPWGEERDNDRHLRLEEKRLARVK
jgi:hypothetical protein